MTPEEIATMGNRFESRARAGEPSFMDLAAAVCYCAAEICERLDALVSAIRSGEGEG